MRDKYQSLAGSKGGGIYLLSSERSGTNLLRTRLCEYSPDICNVPPVHILRTLGYWEPLMGPFERDENWMRAVDYALRSCYERAVPWKHVFDAAAVQEVYRALYGDQRSLVALCDVLYRLYAKAEGKDWYFCKDLWLFDFAEAIAAEVPGARFIHLYRDPRDYVLSQRQRPFGNQCALELASTWLRECNASLLCSHSPRIKDRCLSFSYEQLLQSEPELLQRIVAWLGVAGGKPAVSKDSKESYQFHEWKNLHLATNRENFGKYRKALSKRQIRLVEGVCWNTMRKLGYQPDSQARPAIGGLDKFLDSILASVLAYVKHTINRYKLRNESIDRGAAHGLVDELTEKFR
jgi:hypothetical protein